MTESHVLYAKPGDNLPYALLREYNDWGRASIDVAGPPRRFWADHDPGEPLVEESQDARRWQRVPTPADLLLSLPAGENWQTLSRRSIARLQAYFLLLEDPERRLDVREVQTLAHQVSLVRHILETENLKRVLIADEVGLGKTVEAGLIIKELLSQKQTLRVLYLAPARLVSNVRREFDRLQLPMRQWVALESDARLTDPRIIASIHRAVFGDNLSKVAGTPPWDALVVDECHHLSAWSPDGADARQGYKLVEQLLQRQPAGGRVILMSGTPHQGHPTRFENLLRLLKSPDESTDKLAGRVIYRTKDDIVDWNGNPVFPNRQVNEPLIVDLGPDHRKWLENIYDFYKPPRAQAASDEAKRRAAGWRCAQAMQWAASSPQAGLGYLVRQAMRAGWKATNPTLQNALATLRPYRLGPPNEDIDRLYLRIQKEVNQQQSSADVDDIETYVPGQPSDPQSEQGLALLLEEGVRLIETAGDEKFERIWTELLKPAGEEKVVLFAQPIETVTALAGILERKTGKKPALIIGGQDDGERNREVEAFWKPDGPQFLVSSRAGGEGINLQVARRLVHIDVPWNPMDLEQRVGRVHRFGSRKVVIVDTVVVKDSREWDAYRVARAKLALIASTMVEAQRFESVFSRVMCLLPQDDFTELMIGGFGSPLSATDQARLAEMVQQGFRKWKEFHDKYGQQNAAIKLRDPGLATWDDVAVFMQDAVSAERVQDHRQQRFVRNGDAVTPIEEEAMVLRLQHGKNFVCGDYGEYLVYSPSGVMTPRIGLNLPEVAEPLRRRAFPGGPAGAALLRWPEGEPLPPGVPEPPFGILGFARQTLERDRQGGWTERRTSLHLYVVGSSCTELQGSVKGTILRALLTASVRKQHDQSADMSKPMKGFETEVTGILRQPSEDELAAQIRHAVTPLMAAVITR